MTNKQRIQTANTLALAEFLHRLEAGALIEGKADSTATLVEWLTAEEDAEGVEGND